MIEIIAAHPPMYGEIADAFKLRDRRDVIFTWGSRIYNPFNVPINPPLMQHEYVHSCRQSHVEEVIASWWRKYIDDPEFRLNEELPAHRAEYHAFCQFERDRNRRSRFLRTIAARLSSPLYGGVIDEVTARQKIMGG